MKPQEAGSEARYTIDLRKLVDKWKDKEGSLIMLLHEVQKQIGYIPRPVSLQLAQMLEIPLARIYEVITFYNFFKLEPPGKHHISICLGTACYLKGAPVLIEEAEKLLEVKIGETTRDGLFYLSNVRCVGCCGLSPVVMVDDKVYGKVDKKRLGEIIQGYMDQK